MKKPELLSPVGDFECLKAAVQNGADSVYLGASSFNARKRAANFNMQNIFDAIKYAKLRDVKVHLTLNTLIKNSEFDDAIKLAVNAYNLGVDAIIVQDLGLSLYLRKHYPQIPLHASTQLTVHNLEGCNILKKFGFSRVVLARELSINEIKYICQNSNIEIETFIHGALCISYSGQCLFSSMVGDRSGNRGLCAQPCRLPYELCDENNKILNKGYLLSTKDLNSTFYLSELIKSGVDCFKIEGRMKSPEYVAEVTKYYRKYINLVFENINLENIEINNIIEKNLHIPNITSNISDNEELTQVFNRGGFSEGHLSIKENKNLIFKEKPNNMGIYIGNIAKINSNKGHLFLKLKNSLNIGDKICIGNNFYTVSELMINGKNVKFANSTSFVEIGRMRGNLKLNDSIYKIENSLLSKSLKKSFENNKEYKKIPITAIVNIKKDEFISLEVFGNSKTIYENLSYKCISNLKPEIANTSPITIDRIKSQISKTGNTQFEFSNIHINLDDGLFIPKISILNDLRRNALNGLENLIIKKSTKNIAVQNIKLDIIHKKDITCPSISLLLNNLNTEFDYSNLTNIDKLYIPLRFFLNNKYKNILNTLTNCFKTYIFMPVILKDTINLNMKNIFKNFNISGAVISNPSQTKFFNNLPLIANYNFNIFNSFSANILKNFNIEKFTISPELNKEEVINLIETSSLQTELIVYGNLPLMTNNYCYLSESNKCFNNCEKLCEKNKKYFLKDRIGLKFRILPDKIFNLTTIFNSKITSIKYDKLNVDSIRIDILDENPNEIQNIINVVKKGDRFEGKNYTNGKIK